MKKNLLIACMGLVLVVSIAMVAQAQGVGEFCSANGDFGVSHDACVTCLNPGLGNAPTCICKLLDDADFKNHGQCVKFYKQFF